MTRDNRAEAGRGGRPGAALRATPARIRDLLSSPNALAAAAAFAVVALVLALYVVFAQVNLTNCLAKYNEASAKATSARAMAAAEDRNTDLAERDLTESERQRQADNDEALDKVLLLMGRTVQDDQTRKELADAFRDLLAVRSASAKVRASNQLKRADLAQRRVVTDQRRAANPVPDPPSTMCGGRASTALGET